MVAHSLHKSRIAAYKTFSGEFTGPNTALVVAFPRLVLSDSGSTPLVESLDTNSADQATFVITGEARYHPTKA